MFLVINSNIENSEKESYKMEKKLIKVIGQVKIF